MKKMFRIPKPNAGGVLILLSSVLVIGVVYFSFRDQPLQNLQALSNHFSSSEFKIILIIFLIFVIKSVTEF
jgi:hypothetical protein